MPKKKVTRVAIEAPAPAKRGPGRPRKIESTTTRTLQAMSAPAVEPAKPRPGRPRKVAAPPVAITKARTPVAKAATTTAASSSNGKPKAGTKTEKIYNLLTRKKGCTRPEVLEETGWPSISMQHTAQILKLKLRTEKPGNGPTRYYGSP